MKVSGKTWVVFILTLAATLLNLRFLDWQASPKWVGISATVVCVIANYLSIRKNGWPVYKDMKILENRVQGVSLLLLFSVMVLTFVSLRIPDKPNDLEGSLRDLATAAIKLEKELVVITEKGYDDMSMKQRAEFMNEILGAGPEAVEIACVMLKHAQKTKLKIDMLLVIEKKTGLDFFKIYSDELVSDQEKEFVLTAAEKWIEENTEDDEDDGE